MKKQKKKPEKKSDFEQGCEIVKQHDMFGRVAFPYMVRDDNRLGKNAAAMIARTRMNMTIYYNEKAHLSPKEWAYVLVHCYLHCAFGHFDLNHFPEYDDKTDSAPPVNTAIWNTACDIYVAAFLEDIKFGEPYHAMIPADIPRSYLTDEKKIYNYLLENGWNPENQCCSTSDGIHMDMDGLDAPIRYDKNSRYLYNSYNRYSADFSRNLAYVLSDAVSISGGHGSISDRRDTPINEAAEWFLGHYPLLGGLAASFKIIQDPIECQKEDVSIAAIDLDQGIIYANPTQQLSSEEWKFVLAHEYLHAGLMHGVRRAGRDPYLWNIACDYVINGWLHDMKVGVMPRVGILYDETLKDKSAEEIYDMILNDMRRFRKLMTFRGYGLGDVIKSGYGSGKGINDGMSIDEFYRNALAQGLEYHMNQKGRGLLPAGLVQEIRALMVPPIPWDVKLARWFDMNVRSAVKIRSYAHPSRRQSVTPDIPRPRYINTDRNSPAVTFGAIVDTSGSMTAKEIGIALGSIASYAEAKEVPAIRVVFVDADAYDEGYMTPEELTGRVEVTGRGGTRLQPAVNLLERAADFPDDGPILIITDGMIENRLYIRHKHAFLLPEGDRLPFTPRGEVFYLKE